jgi:DinB superfamily
MSTPLRTLLPPGGFSNLVGHHVAALDLGLDGLKAAARALPAERQSRPPAAGLPTAHDALRASGRCEAAWLHQAVGRVPSPSEPPPGAGLEALLGWLDATRTVSLMVLRPLADRDLERLVELPGVPGRTTLRRLLSELLEHQAERRAEVRLCGDVAR